MKQKILAVILGGGQGTRLYPLTQERSKPAVPIGGKFRLVDIPISNCLNSGINKILVLTQFNSASLNSHIKNAYHFDIFSKGFVEILAADQDFDNKNWYQGTADAVRKSQKHLNKFEYDYLLILSGDQLYQMDFNSMIEFHIKHNSDISIATIPVVAEDATGFGILKANSDNKITAFTEKPNAEVLPDWKSEVSEKNKAVGKEYLASMGIYIFNRSVMKKILENSDANDFGKEIIPAAIHHYNTTSFEFNGYWTDIGTIRSFFEANIDLTRDIPQFNLYGTHTFFTNSRMLPPTKIMNAVLDHVIFAEGCIISAERIETSIVGIRSRIDTGTVMKNCYMMGADYFSKHQDFENFIHHGTPLLGIGENCHIENAILDKNCRIGKNVTIKGSTNLQNGDYENYTVSDGIVIIKKFAVIPNGTVIA